jgi:hypothetical protein
MSTTDTLTTVTATMETLDLRKAEQTPVTGRHVWKLQAMINVWLRSADTPAHEEPRPLLVTDGIGGPRTKAEVLHLQWVFDIAQDAIVGQRTWRALFEFDGPLPG